VFLDEVADLSPDSQAKLLRIVEDQQVKKLGATRPNLLDVRFVSASNADLEHAVMRGVFRKDLYYRINRVTIVVPPLRDRPSEIEPLARLFAGGRELMPEAIELLTRYSWPGNVRELKNTIERAVLFAGSEAIGRHHLPIEKFQSTMFGGPTPYGPRELVAPPPIHEPQVDWDDQTTEAEIPPRPRRPQRPMP
jgi:Nif-specific regulatory protein